MLFFFFVVAKRNECPISAIVEIGTEFLTKYNNAVVGYKSVNSTRSALSSFMKNFHNVPVERSASARRFMREYLI